MLVVLVIGVAFGGYLMWQKYERDRLVAEAPPPPPPPAKPDNRADLPVPEAVKEEKKQDGEIIVIANPADKEKEPMPPPRFSEKADLADLAVKPVRNTEPTDLDRRVWDAIKSSKPGKPITEFPFKIPVLELKRRRELEALVSEYEKVLPEYVVAHPLAKDFPGDVPARVTRWRTTLDVTEGQDGGWQSTGFYAPPGEIITVELSEYDAARGFRVQIGSHPDNILSSKREEWHRFPRIVRGFALNKAEVRISNPFGGLVFLQNTKYITKERPLRIRFTGVVKAPCFFLGKTTHEEWSRLRVETKGVPWGELVGKKHVAMLPGDQMRECADPVKFAEYWDKLVYLQDYLTGVQDKRGRAERFCADAEITVGSGHSGYPWCGYLDWAKPFTDKKAFKSDNWGINHEVGHNHQSGQWTFKGYGEVTNNLIGMYVMQELAGLKFREIRGGAWKDSAIQAIAFKEKGDAFELLSYYVPVIEQFGWEPLRKTFTSYHEDPVDGEDDDKKAEFVYRWSVACGVDLSDYSVLFGFPKNHLLKYKLAQLKPQLKPWMPQGYPPSLSKIKRIARKKDPAYDANADAHAAAVSHE